MEALRSEERNLRQGHVPLPAAMNAAMGWFLAAGLQYFGWLHALDHSINRISSDAEPLLLPGFPSAMPLWVVSGLTAFGLSWAILRIPSTWRRVVVWISTLAVIAAWVPVAAIANAYAPVAAPLVACGWAGLCAIVYAHHHRMAADENFHRTIEITPHESEQDGND